MLEYLLCERQSHAESLYAPDAFKYLRLHHPLLLQEIRYSYYDEQTKTEKPSFPSRMDLSRKIKAQAIASHKKRTTMERRRFKKKGRRIYGLRWVSR